MYIDHVRGKEFKTSSEFCLKMGTPGEANFGGGAGLTKFVSSAAPPSRERYVCPFLERSLKLKTQDFATLIAGEIFAIDCRFVGGL